jgi:type III restriction enzyme
VHSISGRLSLREPQRRSLEILDRVCEIAPTSKQADPAASLEAISREFPSVSDFERDFPSLCFALATGVGKTRLMGAFIAYLHQDCGVNNFFVMAPNLTIYDKLIGDFSPASPKYVFRGISEFAAEPPLIITGDNYESGIGVRGDALFETGVHVNIFNISKINDKKSKEGAVKSAVPRFRRLNEYIGESYFEYLSALPDLVLIMDESHRYRASAGMSAINELKPVLGLELTATPFIEAAKGQTPFKNVIYDYPLARAMEDGFVKEPAVVTQKDFDARQFTPEQLEKIKLEDGVRIHEATKVELATYAANSGLGLVKPFMLVIARDTTHAGELLALIESEGFFEGRYKGKAIQVDSSRTGAEEEAMIERLLAVEKPTEETEIVIHVNMLKEGWDVTNLYTIVPLRAANARTLVEQSIGRGLRLPYGKRTGVATVDRLNIIAHDRFQEIIDEANRPGSVIRMQTVILDPGAGGQKPSTVVATSVVKAELGLAPTIGASMRPAAAAEPMGSANRAAAEAVLKAIKEKARDREALPSTTYLEKPELRASIAAEAKVLYAPSAELDFTVEPDFAEVTDRVVELLRSRSIDIPRIIVLPKGEGAAGFSPFEIDARPIANLQPVSRDVLIQHLRTQERYTFAFDRVGKEESRLEDYIVRALVDFDDVSYDDDAELLYSLASQVVSVYREALDDDGIRNILAYHQKRIGEYVHSQMLDHRRDGRVEYEAVVKRGFTEILDCAFTVAEGDLVDIRATVTDKSRISSLSFTGFSRCIYDVQKFDSDTERKFAIICDRDSGKWMKPARRQLNIFYKLGHEQFEYVPDFIVELDSGLWLAETKMTKELASAEVRAKRDAAVAWCGFASEFTAGIGQKPWRYSLVPHDAVSESMSLETLLRQYEVRK